MMFKRLAILSTALAAACLAGCKGTPEAKVSLSPLACKALYDTTSSYYTDFSNYPKNIADLPIGIFFLEGRRTSALECALTLDAFDNITAEAKSDRIRDFAGEHFICYTALSGEDNVYDSLGRLDLHDAALKHTLFLVGDKCAEGEKERAKIVIASGDITRSTGLGDIANMLQESRSGVKIIGVVDEGVRSLLDILEDTPASNYAIAMIADSVTIASGAYRRALADIMAERGLKGSAYLVCQSLEAADSLSSAGISKALATIIERHYSEGRPTPISALIADFAIDDSRRGALLETVAGYRSKRIGGDYPYRSAIDEKLIIINPSQCAAKECYRTLRGDNNLALRLGEQQVTHYSDLPL